MGLQFEDPSDGLYMFNTHAQAVRIVCILLLVFLYNSQEKESSPSDYHSTTKKKEKIFIFLKEKGIDIGQPARFNFSHMFKKYNNMILFDFPVVKQSHSS